MKKKLKANKTKLVLGIVMSSLIMVTLGVSSFAYWQKDSVEVTIPTYEFNATEEEFTYYACVPNVASTTGYDYYDLESIPTDLVDRVTALAAVRFEALTKTAYIPSYPKVTIGGTRFNYSNSDLPVIHVLNSLSSDDAVINNGFSHIETLIIPETITYIQPGSFYNSTNLKEVTILGELNPDFSKDPKAKKAGYLSVSNTEFGSAKIYKKDANRVGSPSISLNTTSLRFAQFGTSFEYDNKTENYYTYVVTGDSAVAANALATGSPSLSANTKYKLTYDGSTITATSYTYSIDLGETTSALVLNTNVNYEEYILNTDMNVVRISSYPVVEVQEFINGELNVAAEAEFDLNKLNASYSSDNIVFDIKYAPSHVYESIHYHTDGEDLLDEKTMTQISAEKAYFLNEVSYKEDVKNGENFIEVTVSDDSYLDLYVRATNEEYGVGVYYVDPTDPDGIKTYIQMEKVGTKYRYEFRGSNAPDGVTIPDEFLFYNGQYSVISYPDYVSDYLSEEAVREHLEDENHGTKRVYLELYKDNGSGNINATMINDDKNPTNEHDYRWYVVYWYNENGKEIQHYFRVYYADSNSTVIIADIPEIAEKFKFVRTNELDTPIKDALKNNWVDMENYCAEDLKFNANPELNLYVFNEWWKDSYYNQFSVTNDGSMPNKNEFKLRNKNYLILSNFGQLGADGVKYLPIDESLGYPEKDVTGEGDNNNSFKLEFTRFDNYLDRNIQTISLPKGTLIEARVINISSTSETPTYFANTMGYPSEATKITANDKDDVAILNPSEFFVDDGSGKIKVLKDCTVEVYLKMEYSESEQSTPVDYKWHFNIKSTGLRGFTRDIVVNPNDQIIDPTMTSITREVGAKTYPTLVSTGTVVKLERNHANTEFEEYRYLDGSSLTGEYVVSPYFEGDRVFGGSSGNTYYGTINPTSPSGELDLTNENLIMFSPNGDKAYEYKYYAAFDDYGNFLTFLSFNRTQTIKEGYQVLSAVVPQALYDFQNVYIYEVDSEGNILGDNPTPLNQVTNLNTLLLNYNQSNFANAQDYIKYDESNSLMFDYFIRQLGQFGGSDNFYTNNIGVTYGVLENPNDPNSDVLYYFNNVKLDLSSARNSSEKYQITTKTNKTTGQTICNNIEGLVLNEQIIDGYYYNGISITGDNKNYVRFMKEGSVLEGDEQYFKEGYYDLVLRKRGNNLYLGYKYLGNESSVQTDYYLYIYRNDVLIDTVKMDHMYNDNHYFADICYDGTITVDVYNEQKVRVYHENNVTYTSSTEYISRFYYGVNSFVTKVNDTEYRLYEVKMGKIALDFNMGTHPIDSTNIRYNKTDYLSDLDYYEVKVKATQATDIYYAKDNAGNTITSLKKHGESYSEYIVNTEFNKVIKIYLNDGYITDKTITLPQPGKYEVSYNSSTGIVSCSKVQNPDIFYLFINDEMVAELEVNPNTNEYYEYRVEEHIVLEKGLDVSANDIRVLDGQGNPVAVIDKVTLTGDNGTTAVTSISVGAYSLTYSIDSTRRVEDKYQVFTYLNFTPLETVTVTYNYQVTETENEEFTTVSKMVVKDVNWKFEIFDLETVDTFYTPVGTYFAGWSTTIDAKEPTYVVGEEYGTNSNLTLYPVFKNRSEKHQVVWVKAPDFDSSGFAIFSLTNLDTTYITGVSYTGYDDYINGTNGKPKYIKIDSEGKRLVTVDQSLFETIGYVHGGIKLVVHLKSEIDGKTSTCTVKVDYPNYDNRQPSTNTYFSKFSSSEYTNNNTHPSNEKTITSLMIHL